MSLKIPENTLPTRSFADGDYMRVVGSDGKSYRVPYTAMQSELNTKASVITNSATGAVASFTDGAALPVVDLIADIEPVQDLNGYDHPWAGGCGKNILKRVRTADSSSNGITYAVNDTDDGITVDGTASANSYCSYSYINASNAQDATPYRGMQLIGSIYPADTGVRCTISFFVEGGSYIYPEEGSKNISSEGTFTVPDTAVGFRILLNVPSGTTVDNVKVYLMIRLASETADAYEPYANICPITGWTQAVIYASGEDTSNPTTYTIDLGDTIYGGTLDVTTGLLTVDKIEYTVTGSGNISAGQVFARSSSANNVYYTLSSGGNVLNGSTEEVVISSHFRTGSGSTPYCYVSNNQFRVLMGSDNSINTAAKMNAYVAEQYAAGTPLQFCVTLIEPVTVQLTAQEVETLYGTNNVWSDTGDTTVTYSADTKLYIAEVIANALNS